MTPLENWRALWRAWSVQLAAIGAALTALLLANPEGLQAAWNAIPPEVRGVLPAQVAQWITLLLFVLVAVARVIRQPGVNAPEAVDRSLGLIGRKPAWLIAALAPNGRSITSIAVHCSATLEGKPFFAADIRRWHKAQGWSDIGYQFVIDLDGTIEVGRAIGEVGSHVKGYNTHSIGICYIGGVGPDGKPKDTRTPAQKAAMVALLTALKQRYPTAAIKGHRDYPGVAKACPSFDAVAEYRDLGK